MKPEDDNKNLILRYQKIMAEQKKKIKNLNAKKYEYIIDENSRAGSYFHLILYDS